MVPRHAGPLASSAEQAPEGEDSLQWLARQIVEDRRFAEAAVKFWWPAIMGSEVAEPPEEEGDADFRGAVACGQCPECGGEAAGAWVSGRGSRAGRRTT